MTESPNEGLNPLDEDRARSMADEGGAAAATVEAAPPVCSGAASAVWFGALMSALATTLMVLWKRRSRA